MKERLRLRKLRASKTPQNSGGSSSATPYRSSQSLGKAIKRAHTSLPKSPKKQWCVVSKLAESVGLKVMGPSTPSTPPHDHGSALSNDTKRLVHEFYQNSDISWQAPGRKDRVIIRDQEDRAGSVYAHVSQRSSQQV